VEEMLVSEVKEEMKKRGITITQLAAASAYSAGFVGQILQRTKNATNLPARIKRRLEEVGIMDDGRCLECGARGHKPAECDMEG